MSKIQCLPVLLMLASSLFTTTAYAQDAGVPHEVASIVNMNLEEGRDKLTSLGYEICSSSLMGKKQDWYNESTNSCVTVQFEKKSKRITEIVPNPAISKCQEGLAASRKVWEKYHDGQAPASSPKIEEERKKLASQGFKVSYWVDEISPGRSSEYWVNDATQKTMLIVWEVQGNKWVMTNSTDYTYGKNPAPKK